MGYNGIVKMGLIAKYDVPYHWHTVILEEWKDHHIAWFKETKLIWETDYYISDLDEYDDATCWNVRKVYFLFKDPKHATMFSLKWAF